MRLGNFGHELALQRAEQEREAGIAAVREPLKQIGTRNCVACGEEIEMKRRNAMPSASRCVECQERLERRTKQRSQR